MSERTTGDGLSKGIGVAVALGALAVGVATTVMNNERTRQVRDELKQRVDELGKRVDELTAEAQKRATKLSSQAQRTIEERRPEIESTIQKSREAVIGGLDRARTVVEQGADRAQEYVQRVGSQVGGQAVDTGDTGDVVANTGNAEEDAMADMGGTEGSPADDLTISSAQTAVSGEDMSGDDFIEQDAEQSGFQMQGSMHAHDTGDAGRESGKGNSGMGEPTIPFRDANNPEADNDVDNEPPHPGDSRTYK